MAGRRQHTIPQFLLKAFASSIRGDEVYTWMYRRGTDGIELNIKNVGVERDFYGTERESDLDARITALENRYKYVVENLRSETAQDRVFDPEIPELVAHLLLRTRYLRQSAIEVATAMTDGIREHLVQPEFLKAAVRSKQAKVQLLGIIRRALTENGLTPLQIERCLPLVAPPMLRLAEIYLENSVAGAATILDQAMRHATEEMCGSMRTHFIDALSNNLDGGPRVEGYRGLNWFIVPLSDCVILGDSVCLFETAGNRRFKPLDEEGDKTKNIFLPLAPRRLLVGTHAPEVPMIDLPTLNEALARCSLEYFVSCRRVPASIPSLASLLGTWSGILSQQEQRMILDEIKRDLPT